MSNNTNVEKNKNSKKFDIITILDNSKRARIFFLIALGISGLGVRLYFFPYDVPVFSDAATYFLVCNRYEYTKPITARLFIS